MSIDGRIKAITKEGDNLRLELEPRIDRNGRTNGPGQPELTVVGYTRTPDVDMQIWGGEGDVEIVGFGWYARIGYTGLKEGRNKMYNADDYMKYFGYFTSATQPTDQPTVDPGLDVGCPFCAEPLTPTNARTVSLMAWGGLRSYFYRLHIVCHETVGEDAILAFEGLLVDGIPADDTNPDVTYVIRQRARE